MSSITNSGKFIAIFHVYVITIVVLKRAHAKT